MDVDAVDGVNGVGMVDLVDLVDSVVQAHSRPSPLTNYEL